MDRNRLLATCRIATLAVTACIATTVPLHAEDKPRNLTIFTSVSGSSWYGIGAGMAEIFAKNGVPANPELGAGLSNVANVGYHKGELGFTVAPALTVAARGQPPFPEPIRNVRVIAGLSSSLMHVFVRQDAGIAALGDLAGRSFMTQRPGTISAIVFEEALKSVGLGSGDLKLSSGDLNEQTDAMKDGRAEGMISVASYPSSWGNELANTVPLKLLPVDDAAFAKLKSDMPTLGRAVIGGGVYKGQDIDVPTVSAQMVVVAAEDMPDGEAYWIAKTLTENLEALKKVHGSFQDLTVSDLANVAGGHLHPGAEKYYRETGAINETGAIK
ncbi:TAXI family TRAP transporter solute-binding subunit [Tistrella mobilis]|uniref:TAXI family TRAP transporter solute-binding subunit n=1 Tax=Tistrella mobilis TaxID=171437 RepID=UPI0035582B0F